MKHLLLLFICAVSLTVWGQETVPYTQTFDGPGLPSGWTTVDNNAALNDPDQVWTIGTSAWDKIPALDGNYALLNSDAYGAGSTQDADLISPVFDLSGYSGSVIILHFDHFFYQFSITESATLSYSINGGAWTTIKTWNYSSSNGETFNQEIPGIAGESDVRFKWNYFGEWAWGWAVDNVSLTEMNTRTWFPIVDNDWNNPGNYFEGSAPDASSRVEIGVLLNDGPVITNDAECYDLNISPVITPLTINPGSTLSVHGTLTNDEVDGILVEADASSSGSLIAGIVAGTGTVKVQAYLDFDGDGWHDVSSPVVQSIGSFLSANVNIPTNGANRGMRTYNTGLVQWNPYFTNATTDNFEPVKGYLLRTSAAGSVEFNGTINNGPMNISISPNGYGWNLIGNPYTSAVYANFPAGTNNFLTWNDGILDANYAALYVWDGTTSSYDIINQSSGAEYLGVGQAFFIKTTSNTTADFTPAMQVHQPTVVLKSETVIPEIELTVSNGKKSFSTSVKFFKDATPGLDKGYDAGIFKADKTFSIFTHLIEDNDVEFGIQCLPFPKSEGMIIPVGIDCTAGGDVTISLNATTVPANYNVVLEDRLLNKFVPFNEANSFYTATLAAETKGVGRFYLHVKSAQVTGIDNLGNAKINAWMDRDEIIVNGVTENNAVAKLFDARGSLILMKNLENTNTNRIKVNGINTGIYMLQVIENGKRTTSKLQISGN